MFKQLPNLYSTSEYWKHTFVIDLNLPKFKHLQVPNCTCPELVSVIKHLSVLHNETHDSVNTIVKKILFASKVAKTTPPRSRRSLLPFIGKIASGLFGVSTENDVKKVADNINRIHDTQNKLTREFKHELSRLSSYMATSNDRLDNAMAEIVNNHDLIVGMQNNFQAFAETASEKQAWIFSRVIDQSFHYNTILNSYQNLYNGFISLRQGKISPQLIPEHDVISVLNMVKYTISSKRPDFKIVHDDYSYYYNFADYIFHRSNAALLFTIKFPISSVNQPFSLLEIIHYPMPLHKNSNHTTSIRKLPRYLAISGRNFISLPDNSLAD